MSAPGFHHVDTWIFDLDNTLYPASCRLFDQIDVRMGEFISDQFKVDRVEARRIQKDFFASAGSAGNVPDPDRAALGRGPGPAPYGERCRHQH